MPDTDVSAFNTSEGTVAASAARFVTAARPNTSATMANTTTGSTGGRNVTVTTSGTGDNEKTCTITGTDMYGTAQTEVITSTGSAEAVAGTKIFKTVTAVECSAQYAANITVGTGTLYAVAVGGQTSAKRMRLKSHSIVSGGTAGNIDYIDGAPGTGTTRIVARAIGTADTTSDYYIPDDGVLFENGIVVKSTVDVADFLQVYYTGQLLSLIHI